MTTQCEALWKEAAVGRPMRGSRRFVLAPAAALLVALLAGCGTTRPASVASNDAMALAPVSDEARQIAVSEVSQAMRTGLAGYPLAAGDNLEISYHINDRAIQPVYTFGVGDEFDVDFRTQPEYNRSVIVRPDGRISLPGKNGLMAVGRSPEGLAQAITTAYRDVLINPAVTILVRKFHTATDDLKELVTRSDAGRVKLIAVEPDGMINAPGVPGVSAAGHTVPEIHGMLDRAYRRKFGNVFTSVRLASLVPNNLFVFGEVRTPGAVSAQGPRSVTQLLAAAGGPLSTAALDQVRLIYVNAAQNTCVETLDLSGVGTEQGLAQDVVVPPNATLYVPSSRLAKIARAVDLVARQIFLFNGFNLGLGASYNINPSVVAK